MPVLEVQDRLDCLQRTHFKSSFWSYKPLRAAYSNQVFRFFWENSKGQCLFAIGDNVVCLIFDN